MGRLARDRGVELEPFELDGMELVPVTLTDEDVELYYEGFSNDTIWPLYHDVISPPAYHREWWEAYVRVNERLPPRHPPPLPARWCGFRTTSSSSSRGCCGRCDRMW